MIILLKELDKISDGTKTLEEGKLFLKESNIRPNGTNKINEAAKEEARAQIKAEQLRNEKLVSVRNNFNITINKLYELGLIAEADMFLKYYPLTSETADITKAEEILNNCGCDSSCHKCLRHYRNHFVHGQLDRFAGLELLRWGKYGELPNDIPHSEQAKYVNQLSSILEPANNKLIVTNDMIKICNNHSSKKVIVYPAIRKSPIEDDTIYVSDAYIKFAKPYALRKLTLK